MARGFLRIVLFLLVVVGASCRREVGEDQPLSGVVALSLEEVVRSSEGIRPTKPSFPGDLKKALESKGVRVITPPSGHFYADDAVSQLPIDALISGKVLFEEQPLRDSRVGGPVPFYFLEGACDLRIVEPKSGKTLEKVQGPLDLRRMKGKALPAARSSYDDTRQVISASVAPEVADDLARRLVEKGLIRRATKQ